MRESSGDLLSEYSRNMLLSSFKCQEKQYMLTQGVGIARDNLFPKDLDISRQVKIFKKTTTLLNLQNMFRQKLLSSSVE